MKKVDLINFRCAFAPPDFTIGSHVHFQRTILKTVEYIDTLPLSCAQIFIGGMLPFKRYIPSQIEIRKTIGKRFTPLFFHAPYTHNLCKDMKEVSFNSLLQELKTCSDIEAQGVVLHPGSNPNTAQGLDYLVDNLNCLFSHLDSPNAFLLLEGPAGEKNKIGLPQHLDKVFEKVNDPRLFMCFDTQHVFGAGVYDLRLKEEIDTMLNRFDKLRLIHHNDSNVPFADKKDRHQWPGEGYIFNDALGGSSESLLYLREKMKEKDIWHVIE